MRNLVIIDTDEALDALSDRVWDEIHPFLGDENPLWGPLAIALAAGFKHAIRKARVETPQ